MGQVAFNEQIFEEYRAEHHTSERYGPTHSLITRSRILHQTYPPIPFDGFRRRTMPYHIAKLVQQQLPLPSPSTAPSSLLQAIFNRATAPDSDSSTPSTIAGGCRCAGEPHPCVDKPGVVPQPACTSTVVAMFTTAPGRANGVFGELAVQRQWRRHLCWCWEAPEQVAVVKVDLGIAM
ncbi:hypothetical protein BC826DRAFT_1102273 [Russula brevipes]|nr:hypothetical protein BC826DRAFT_1102273 [Russula brevipes]